MTWSGGLKDVESAFAYIEEQVETPAMKVPLFWHGCYLVIKKEGGLKQVPTTHISK